MRFFAFNAALLLAGTLAEPHIAHAEGASHDSAPALAAPTQSAPPAAGPAPVAPPAAPVAPPARDTRAQCVSEHEQTQIERKKEALLAARAAALSCSQPECPGLLRADCVQWFAELDREVPSVVISVRAGANDVSAATVSIDGRPFPQALDGQLLELDPGLHKVDVSPAGQPALVREVVLAAGEKARLLVFEMPSGPVPLANTPTPEPARPMRRPVPALTWILSGTAVAAVGAGSIFGALSLSKRSDLERKPADGGCSPYCTDAEVAPVHHLSLTADVLFGVAALSAVGAAVSYALRPEVPVAASRLQLDFGVANGGASFGVRGSL